MIEAAAEGAGVAGPELPVPVLFDAPRDPDSSPQADKKRTNSPGIAARIHVILVKRVEPDSLFLLIGVMVEVRFHVMGSRSSNDAVDASVVNRGVLDPWY
ncbi:MAG: hypothetical protein U0271_36830 [Polyangiaceae bacterium]